MAEKQTQAAAGAAATETTSLLEQAITATRQTERSRAEELLKTLTTEALKGTVSFDKDVTRSLTASIKAIDAAISKQLAPVMHKAEFQQLEETWRALNHLGMNS